MCSMVDYFFRVLIGVLAGIFLFAVAIHFIWEVIKVFTNKPSTGSNNDLQKALPRQKEKQNEMVDRPIVNFSKDEYKDDDDDDDWDEDKDDDWGEDKDEDEDEDKDDDEDAFFKELGFE